MPALKCVSVIIPALNEADHITRTIAAARREYAPSEVEIVVVDGGSTDGTPDQIPSDVHLLHAPRGRAVQMNHGATAAHGDILLFCHADTQLPSGWREAVVDALRDPNVSGGSFRVTYLPARGILHLLNRVRYPPDWRNMHGDQAPFMRSQTFRQVGGYPEIPLMEDVEMGRALHNVGRIVRLPLRVISSSRRFLEGGPLRQLLLSTWFMIRYLYLGATPEDIARLYRSSREERIPSENKT